MALIAKRYKEQNWELVIGDVFVLTVNVVDENDVALDITGASFAYKAAATTDIDLVGTITDAVNGALTLTFTEAKTLGHTAGNYSHQCQMTDGSGNKSTIFEGKIRLIADLITA